VTTILLTAAEINEADIAGANRRRQAQERRYYESSRNNGRRTEAERQFDDMIGTRGERAAVSWLSEFDPVWHSFKGKFFGLADLEVVGFLIDVKTKRLDEHSLVVKPIDIHPNWIYLSVCCARHPSYNICGWALPADIKKRGRWAVYRPDGGAWYLRDLRPPSDLWRQIDAYQRLFFDLAML